MSDQIGHTFAATYEDRIDLHFDRDSDPEGDPLLMIVSDHPCRPARRRDRPQEAIDRFHGYTAPRGQSHD